MYWNLCYCYYYGYRTYRLIVTWDVLKQKTTKNKPNIKKINSNMRCIETRVTVYLFSQAFGLIVTWDVLKLDDIEKGKLSAIGLIVTWDVLKPVRKYHAVNLQARLIVTWDVLKLPSLAV